MAKTVTLIGPASGLALTLKLFPWLSDTIANGAGGDSMTAATNRPSTYTASVDNGAGGELSGLHSAHITDGADGIWTGYVDMSEAAPFLRTGVTPDLYHADIDHTRDGLANKDEYTVIWFRSGVRITSGITSPTMQIVKRADGTDLVAAAAMTQIGSTGAYKYDASTRLSPGEAALAIASATIDGAARTFARVIARDYPT